MKFGIAKLYRALWHYAAGRRKSLVFSFSFLISAELLRLAVPWLAGDAMNAIQSEGSAGITHAARNLLLVFLSIACGWALHAPGRILERNVALQVRTAFTMELLRRLLHAPLSWHRSQHSAETTHRVVQSTDALHQFAETQYVYLQNTVLLVGPLIALWLISAWVGAVAVFGFTALSLISLGFDRRLIRYSIQRNDAERRHSIAWIDTFANLLTIYALRRFAGVEALIRTRLMQLFAPLRHIVWLNEAKWASIDIFGAMLWCLLVALYAGLALSHHDAGQAGLAIGSLYMVYEYARRAETVMSVIAGDFAILAGQQANFASAQVILDAPQAHRIEAVTATTWRELKLDRISYRHAEATHKGFALDALELSLVRGQRYALVGPSGAGKSSLLRLLSGLESPSAGQVLRDDVSIDSESLRREATLIPQEAELFVGSLAENLTLGAELAEREIVAALKLACATEFVEHLSKGLATPVNEGGVNWSGGQRQRLALARGVLAACGSSLVLFDEPTSHLDPDNEARVLQALLAGFPGSTLVVALHRLHLLNQFDAVIFMADGRIVDIGSVAVLHERCAAFRMLFNQSDAKSSSTT